MSRSGAGRRDAASSVAPISTRYGRSLRPCLAAPIIRLTTGDHPEGSSHAWASSTRRPSGSRRYAERESRAARRGTRLPECEGRRRPRRGPPLRARHDPRSEGRPPSRARPLVDEELHRSGGVDRPSRPLGLERRAEQALVEAPRSVNVVRKERDFDELAHVAISNSRSTSFSEVLRSVEALRSPTMSAQGSS